jgi:hypothetical protein
MSGEEAIETNAEVTEAVEPTSEAIASEVVTDEQTDSAIEEFSLQNLYEVDDSELDVYLQNAEGSDMESSMSEETVPTTELEAEPPSEGVEEQFENEIEDGISEPETLENNLDTDYKAIYEELFDTPIKASGRDIKIESVEEAKRLIQQGVDYHKKMQEFSPFRKAMSLLKKRDALDPERLDFLLDVADGKPEAVAKLLKDREINPYDIDVEQGEQYQSNYQDTESIDRLEDVLQGLPTGGSKDVALDILGNSGWDTESKRVFFTQPETVQVLHKQIESGIYDKVMDEVTKRKALGEFVGIPDIDAYNRVGQELANQGKLGVPNTPTERSTPANPDPQEVAAQNEKRRKAASAPRKPVSNAPVKEEAFNPATASDEEVEKFLQDHLRRSAGG